MGFALCPDDGPPRIWRYVGPGVLQPGLLCDLDIARNILTIDKERFDALPEIDRHMVLRTHGSITYSLSGRYRKPLVEQVFA